MTVENVHTPASEEDLSDLIRAATSPLAIRGGGTRGVNLAGDTVGLDRMAGITLYEPSAMTLVVKVGTPISEIEAIAKAENQRLAFEPVDYRALLGTQGEPTIGGVFASNASGPRRISVGAARDFLLGVRYVDGAGQIVKNGGRVMKNVTGYDLVKLMAGAHGTLGVLTEVSLKVLPCPEVQSTLILHGLDDKPAIAALARALGSPFEVSAAAHDPQSGETMLRVEGFEASVKYRLAELQKLLGGETSIETDSEARWINWRDQAGLADGTDDIWRVSCKPSDGPGLASRSGANRVNYDWAGGLIWLSVPKGYDLRTALGQYDGHATCVRGTDHRRFEPPAPGVARISAGLRNRFDPRGLLNAGLMG